MNMILEGIVHFFLPAIRATQALLRSTEPRPAAEGSASPELAAEKKPPPVPTVLLSKK